MHSPPLLDTVRVRRLALDSALLLGRSATTRRPLDAAQRVIDHFGYVQLDSVSVVGARAHALTLGSRVRGLRAEAVEAMLRPGAPLFEYWGHEACWMPLELYPVFGFRREGFRSHPWWGDVAGAHPREAEALLQRVRDEGPLRSADLEGGGKGWWNLSLARKLATALWSSGELAIRERNGFIRTWDLAERVIPEELRSRRLTLDESLRVLLVRALAGHGWATTATLVETWRLRRSRADATRVLAELAEEGAVVACDATLGDSRQRGWVLPAQLERAEQLASAQLAPAPRLLCPFDPVLWDRDRVQALFGFEQKLEIYTPAPKRRFGYYVLPLLVGDALIGRADLRRDPRSGRVEVLQPHFEGRATSAKRAALDRALADLQSLTERS